MLLKGADQILQGTPWRGSAQGFGTPKMRPQKQRTDSPAATCIGSQDVYFLQIEATLKLYASLGLGREAEPKLGAGPILSVLTLVNNLHYFRRSGVVYVINCVIGLGTRCSGDG